MFKKENCERYSNEENNCNDGITFNNLCCCIFYGCTNKSSYSNSDDAYINYATDMQLMYHIGGNAPMTKSDKGYYYIGEDGIVIFIDKETKNGYSSLFKTKLYSR